MAIILTLLQVGWVNLYRFQQTATTGAAIDTLVSDIRNQQIRAMNGDTYNTGTTNNFGIYFQSDRYTLFFGSAYSAAASTNFVIRFEPNIRMTGNTFASNQLIFVKGSGEINTTDLEDTVTLQNTSSGETTTIRLNRMGAITQIQ